MMWNWRWCKWVGAVTIACSILCGISSAAADEVIELEPLRSWSVPIQVSPYTAHIDASVDGTFLMMSRPVEEEEWECRVVVSDPQRTLAYTVRQDYEPTRCVDAVVHPEGGFVLRGEVRESSPENGRGFTSRIASDGEILWTVDDAEFFESDGEAEFAGNYVGAVEGLSYDAKTNHVMALTKGERQLADQTRSLVQAHSMDAESGELIGSGKTFGPTDNDVVVEMVARDGEFLVVTVDDRGEEQRFYSHEVGLGAFRFEPIDVDWSQYELSTPVRYRSEVGTFYVWSGDDGFEVARMEGGDSKVWSKAYNATVEIEGRPEYIGEPDRLWVSDEVVVIRHNAAGQHPYLRFIDREDGMEKAMVVKNELTSYDEVDLVYGDDGALILLAINPVGGQMWEYGIELATPNDTSGHGADTEEEAKGCAKTSGPVGWTWVMGLLLWWGLRRADVDCQSRGRALS